MFLLSHFKVSKYCIETGNVLWTNCEIQKPASVSCCKLGRVFVLVKPTDICVLNGLTGKQFVWLSSMIYYPFQV